MCAGHLMTLLQNEQADYRSLCVGVIHIFILVHLGLCTYMHVYSIKGRQTKGWWLSSCTVTHTVSLITGFFELRFRSCTDWFWIGCLKNWHSIDTVSSQEAAGVWTCLKVFLVFLLLRSWCLQMLEGIAGLRCVKGIELSMEQKLYITRFCITFERLNNICQGPHSPLARHWALANYDNSLWHMVSHIINWTCQQLEECTRECRVTPVSRCWELLQAQAPDRQQLLLGLNPFVLI